MDLTPLAQPMSSQVKIDPTAKDCPSDGFNYPLLRQLNKKARVYLSRRFNLNSSVLYHSFAVSNSKGWFAAVQVSPAGSNIVFSTLEDLRSAFAVAKEGSENLFSARRILPIISANVNLIAFASNDTRFVVGLENGSVMIYDTALLFSSGEGDVSPIKTTQVLSSPLRQILPNPSTDPSLCDLLAIVGDGKVILLNTQLEPQGGWAASDLMTQPISISWSPKGKHIAIGLQTGDILTFSPTNKTTPNKHIPPTADAILVSLQWLGPGHTFRTTYAPQDNAAAKQHIVTLDNKSLTATYAAPDHPFMAYDRTQQNAYLLSFPKWDEDQISTEETKSLTILGDFSSVDIEVLGNVGNKWFRQSQDNPLTLPLDSSMDDTVLLSLAADLTDTTAAAPIIYAYLNDGSLQGWHAEHNKPYIGIPSPDTSSSALAQSQNAKDTETRDTEMVSDSATPTPASMATTFGQSDSLFGQRPNAGKTVFGQAQDTPAFGQAAFGQASFGQASFGQSNQSNNNTTFGSVKPATGFGAFASAGAGAFGSSTFNGFGSPAPTGNTFVQGSLTGATPTQSTSDAFTQNISPTITQEASMSDSTTDLGGLSLGTVSDTKSVNAMFGSFGAPTISNQTEPPLGGLVKPASGFGGFGGFKTSGAFDLNNKISSTANLFATPVSQNTSSGFGQTGFGQSRFGQTSFGSGTGKATFGQPAFGQPAFGKTSLGETATIMAAPTSGGFGAFANAPTGFTNASTKQQAGFGTQESKPQASGGFAAATLLTGPSTANAPTSKQPSGFVTQELKPDTGGFAAFASPIEKPFGSDTAAGGFTPASKGFSAFASTTPVTLTSTPDSKSEPPKTITPATSRTSVFGTPLESTKGAATSTTPKETPTRTIALSPPSSPEPKFASVDASPSPKPALGGAFANIQTTPSSFQPAAGFGAFASTTPKDSPFFKKQEQTTPATPFTPTIPKTQSSTTTTPTFGSTSILGPSRSAFGSTTPTPASPTPVKSTTTPSFGGSAFSAFSGSSSPLAVVAGQQKSFFDLLKTGGEESKDPEKPPAPLIPTKGAIPTASQDKEVTTTEDKGKGKSKALGSPSESTGRDESFSNISVSSSLSSFVEIEIPEKDEEHDQSSDQDDRSDFLTDEETEEGGGSDEESLPEEDEIKSPTPSPMTVPLPPSRSASATPQPEVKVQVSVSPSIQESPPQEEGTTSPGTPPKEIKLQDTNGLPSAASPLGIGLGRPSTRPVRRSPLANAVVLSQEAEPSVPEASETPSSSQRPTTPPSAKGPASLPTPPSPASGIQSPSVGMLPKKSIIPVSPSVFSFGQRPATTPPASSLFGQAPNKSAHNVTFSPLVPPTTVPSTSQQQSLFGTRPTIAPATVPNVFGMTSFTLGKTPPPVAAGSPGIPSTSAPSMFPLQQKVVQGTPDRGLFGIPSKQAPNVAGSAPAQAAPKTQENEVVEEGMQKECINLVRTVEKELEELTKTVANARHVLATLNVSLGGSKIRADLGNPARWGLADLKLFGQVLLQYEKELAILESNRDKEKQAIGEIKSNILKAGTRREEIARFNKAKDDKDFARMLKARTLGPEHSETQTQLRKSIRAVRDRVQKLEKRLQDDKKKLAEAQSCKPRIKAPTLDTINRTYRNIGIAIEQQTDEINFLAIRISKINIVDVAASSLSQSPLVQRDARLPDPPHFRHPINITPHVAVTTAAALNAERSAQRLKKALLAVRKEPLLNTKAAASPIAPLAINSPAKLESDAKDVKLKGFEDLRGPLFSEPAVKADELGINDWSLPEDHFDPSGSHINPSTRRDKTKRTHRGGSVARKSPGPDGSAKLDIGGTFSSQTSTETVPVSFDWGPLPTFASPTPLKTLPMPFVPISPPAQNSTASGTNVSKTPEPKKSLPQGFVSFATFSSRPVTSSVLASTPSSNGEPNKQKGSGFAPPTTPANPSQGFSFSNLQK